MRPFSTARKSAQTRSAPAEPTRAGGQSPADGAVLVGDASRDAVESSTAQPRADNAAPHTEYQAAHATAQQYTETEVESDDDSVQILDDLTNRHNGAAAAADSRHGVGQDVDMRDGNVTSDQSFDPASTPSAVHPDHPLPHRTYKFDILNHAPARHPSAPLAHKPLETMTSQERSEEHLRAQDRMARERAQRQVREAAGNDSEWARDWRNVKGKQRENTQNTIYHSAAFFPHAQLPGLEYMRGVFAVIGRDQIELHRANLESATASTSARTARSTIMLARYKLPPRSTDPRDAEELFTCAWSVNITTNPYTPMLAVAGRGRPIEVFLVGQRANGEWLVHLDRTITGHGGSIFHLTFHPSYPHLLASCSEDKTVRLWDVTVPWGTNEAVHRVETQTRRGKTVEKQQQQQRIGYRPRVEGELLAILAERGHEQAVFSCDMHAVQPLLVTAGADGYIRLWTIPQSVLDATPFWPTTPLHRPPSNPPPKDTVNAPVPVLGPPFFSSYAVHPGQWPDQVLFASPTTCTIISKAGVSHEEAQFSPRKSVKVWVPDVLDVLGPRSADRNREDLARAPRDKDESALPSLTEMRSHLPVDARSDSAFRIIYEAVLEDQNCIADVIGWFRPRPRRQPCSPLPSLSNDAQDAFFALATSTKLPPPMTKQTNRTHNPPALYLFRPFADPSVGVPKVRRDSQNLSASTQSSLRRSTSLAESQSGSQIQTGSHPPVGPGPEELVDALFPPTRDRQAHDFVPRLLPSRVLDFPSPSTASASRDEPPPPAVHARCIAIDPQDAETIVAVGDHGLLVVWSRSKA